MKKTINYLLLTALISVTTSMTFAQTKSQEKAKANESKPLIIYSSQGRIEIKDTAACRQSKDTEGKISIQCADQCTQTTDPKDGKIVISC